jgi:arylsulfatase
MLTVRRFAAFGAMGLALSAPLAVSAADAQTAAPTFDRTVLPIEPLSFTGKIGKTATASVPAWPQRVRAPAGAPNVLVILTDDVGFSAASTFGGPIRTPNLDRLAARGLIYNRFHVTSICSPTRAALLTGRNPHDVGFGIVGNLSTGFPGYDNLIPRSAATVARVLRDNGYSTAMFGKNHTTPDVDLSAAGPFEQWPTGLGFDYFYGFNADEANQFTPGVYRNTTPVPPRKDAVLDKALADEAIGWLHNQDAAHSDRPFFIYYAPGSTHMPHQAPADWIEKFRGKFDQGWDAVRSATANRQLAMGVVPKGTVNTPRPEGLPAWDSLTPLQRKSSARFMEAYAGMLAYQDAQIGRLLDEIDRMGKSDNTLVMFVEGDNGAQAAPGITGTINAVSHYMNNVKETDEDHVAMLDKIGGPDTLPDYGAGWAWAMTAPFPYFKTFASHLGGTRNGLVVSWPRMIKERGLRTQFSHVDDIMPTILEAAGLPAPVSVDGVKQQPIAGVSLIYSFNAPQAPERHTTQYFEVTGNRAIYHDGWWANTTPTRYSFRVGTSPGETSTPTGSKWELYDLKTDYSQSHDLAAKYPQKLAEMRDMFDRMAEAHQVYPIDDTLNLPRFLAQGQQLPKRDHFTFWGGGITVPPFRAPPLFTQSFTLTANIDLPAPSGNGTVAALGSKFGGWSFFLKDGKPGALMAVSQLGRGRYLVQSAEGLKAGKATVTYTFDRAKGWNAGGTMTIAVNGKEVARGPIGATITIPADPTAMFTVGFDGDTPVTDFFPGDASFSGAIDRVDVQLRPAQ